MKVVLSRPTFFPLSVVVVLIEVLVESNLSSADAAEAVVEVATGDGGRTEGGDEEEEEDKEKPLLKISARGLSLSGEDKEKIAGNTLEKLEKNPDPVLPNPEGGSNSLAVCDVTPTLAISFTTKPSL